MPPTQVLPVNGTREALFAFAQAVIDGSRPAPVVVCPNPFYQIYEGAALLAGAEPAFLNQTAAQRLRPRPRIAHRRRVWRRTQLLYVCSPGNPTGRVLDARRPGATLFERADRYGFVIASDECYSEIYPDESAPPLGGLEAAQRLGRDGFRNLVVFTSLSKRSNAPGLRSGGVAGDAALLRAVSALSHLSWRRDESRRPARQHRRLARRGARARQPRAVPGEVRRRRADARRRCCRHRGRTPASTSGRACPEATTSASRGTVCGGARHRAARAGISRATRTARTRAAVTSASRSSPDSRNASTPPGASWSTAADG